MTLYQVDPPPAAKKIRELVYSTFFVEDHALHFYFLGGPDFVVGPEAPAAERNVLGVIAKVGVETGKKVIAMRRRLRELIALAGGKVTHPVFGLPGGVAKRFTPEMQKQFQEVAAEAVEFGQFTLQVFEDVVLKNTDYVRLILSDAYTHRTYYMGMVDEKNQVNFYDGRLRVVTPEGKEWRKFPAGPVPGEYRRARRTLELREVLLPEAGRLERLHRRRGQRHLLRCSAGTSECRRRHGDAARAGSLREVLRRPSAASRCTIRWPIIGRASSSCSMPPSA